MESITPKILALWGSFFSKYLKFNVDSKNAIETWEKVLGFSDSCIWIGRFDWQILPITRRILVVGSQRVYWYFKYFSRPVVQSLNCISVIKILEETFGFFMMQMLQQHQQMFLGYEIGIFDWFEHRNIKIE